MNKRSGALAVLFTGLFLLGAVLAASAAPDCDRLLKQPDYQTADLGKPMRFFRPEKYACLGNAVNNPYLAVGTITEATPSMFAEFAKRSPPDAPIEFHSPGGNLIAALKLGQMVRVGMYDTSLGALCASACAYAIMGGVNRYIAETAFDADSDYDNRNIGATGHKLGIHQFYQSAALDEPLRKAFSAVDKSTDQMLMAILLEYALRMGVDLRLVSAASSIPPWQEMRWLTQDEMIEWKVDNTHRKFSDLAFHSFGRTGSYVEVDSIKGSADSHLRIFCRARFKEPLFAFVTDWPGQAPQPAARIAAATDQVRRLLGHLKIALTTATTAETWVGPFEIQEVTGLERGDHVRVYAAVRPSGFGRQSAEALSRVALTDDGSLARADWSFQDIVKFKLQGDKKLIGLAMRNCVE